MQTQNINILTGAGLSTDVDDKLLSNGKVVELTNGYSIRTGEIAKRPGYIDLPILTTVSGILPNVLQLTPFGEDGNTELVALLASDITTSGIAVLNNNEERWGVASDPIYAAGLSSSLTSRLSLLERTTADIIQPIHYNDIAIAQTSSGTVYIRTWSNATPTTPIGQIKQVIETPEGQVLWSSIQSGGNSRCVGIQDSSGHGWACFAWSSMTGQLNFNIVNMTTPQFVGIVTTVVSDSTAPILNADCSLDMIVDPQDSTRFLVCYHSISNDTRGIRWQPSTEATTLSQAIETAASATISSRVLAWVVDLAGSGKVGLLNCDSAGTHLQWNISTPGSTWIASSTKLMDNVGVNALNVTGYTVTNSATGTVSSFSTEDPISNFVHILRKSTCVNGSVLSSTPYIYEVDIASKPFTLNNQTYMIVYYGNTIQNTYFILNINQPTSWFCPDGRFAVWKASKLDSQPISIATATQGNNGPNSVIGFFPETERLTALAGLGYTNAAIITIQLDQDADNNITHPIYAAGNIFIPGSQLNVFDGTNYTEYGFSLYPADSSSGLLEILKGVTVAGGGLLTGTEYDYKFVYSYIDAHGNLIRSDDSAIFTITTSGGNNAVKIQLPGLHVTGHSVVNLEWYRATPPDTNFQFVDSIQSLPTQQIMTWNDIRSAAQISRNAFIYTTGGIVANDPPPPCSGTPLFHMNRLFIISADNPREVWFSGVITPTVPPHFSTSFVIDLPFNVQGLGSIDDKLIILTTENLYVLQGSGPLDDGFTNAYGDPNPVARGLGTNFPNAIVSTPIGVFFIDLSGRIMLLDRALTPQYIGQPVDGLNKDDIFVSTYLPEQNQVRFYSLQDCLMYDIKHDCWSHYSFSTDGFIVDASIFSGLHTLVIGTVPVIEDMSSFSDVGAGYIMEITTPWLNLSQLDQTAQGLGGYARLSQFQGLGLWEGNHTVNISIANDFDNTINQTRTKVMTGTTQGGRWLWRFDPRDQKKSSWKFTIADSGETNDTFRLTGFSLLCGIKQGMNKTRTGITE